MSWLASKLAWTVELSVSQAWNFPWASVSAEYLAASIRNASSGSASLFAGLAGHSAGSAGSLTGPSLLATSLTSQSPKANGQHQTLDFQCAASEVRAAVSSRVPSIFVTAIVNASSVSHAARVIPRSASSSPGVRRACARRPAVDQDSLWLTSTLNRRGRSRELSSRCSLPPAGLCGLSTPAPQDVVQFGFAHLQE